MSVFSLWLGVLFLCLVVAWMIGQTVSDVKTARRIDEAERLLVEARTLDQRKSAIQNAMFCMPLSRIRDILDQVEADKL